MTLEQEIRRLVGAESITAPTEDKAVEWLSEAAKSGDPQLAAEIKRGFNFADSSADDDSDDGDNPLFPAIVIDRDTHRRVRKLARKNGRGIHQTLRDLVRSGLDQAETN